MNYRFQNLLGAPYRGGNIVFSDTTLISSIGNRISVTEVSESKSSALPFYSPTNISRLACSPDSSFIISIDSLNHCVFANLRLRVPLHHLNFKEAVHAVKFSPDGVLIAFGVGKLVQVWKSPGFKKEFSAFQLVKTFAGFDGAVRALDWSPDSQWLLAGSKDLTARLFCLKKLKRLKPFVGHRDVITGVFFHKNGDQVNGVYTVSKDGALFSWDIEFEVENNGVEFSKAKDEELSDPPSPGTPEIKGSSDVQKTKIVDRLSDEEGYLGKRNRAGEFQEIETQESKIGQQEKQNSFDDNIRCPLHKGTWVLRKKYFFMQPHAKLTACDYHAGLDIMVVGFSSGVFELYQMPDITLIHSFSISREKITTASFNKHGNWLALGCARLGQLLVWEWRSETYVFKQQGHYFDVNCMAYSPDSQILATGADDKKIKLWNVSSGFCFVTLSENGKENGHTNAVTALHFTPNNRCLLSASLDGTVRAWDLIRYRNFRTFTTPYDRQFVSLTSDPSGEVICAGSLDSFEIFVWRMKDSRLLDTLSGHEGPVHGLTFSPINAVLASSSWDKTVRLWDVFDGKGAVETFPHTHDVLTVVYRPDGKQLACSTLDGQIHFWDPVEGLLMYTIEGRRDIAGGRLMSDRRSAEKSTSGKCFTSLCYSVDGSYILAGGNSKYICMYDVADQVLLRRFQTSSNRSLDGVLDFLNSKRMTDAGPLDLIDDVDSDVEDGIDQQIKGKLGYDLPGAIGNHGRPVIRTKCLRIAPTGRSWAAATTEGVLIYSIDDSFLFDPNDLDIDVTPEAVETALSEGQHLRALVLGLRLNDDKIIKRCIFAVKPPDVSTVAASVPTRYLNRLMETLADLLDNAPHLEFVLVWCQELCKSHGHTIQQNYRNLLPSLRSLQKSMTRLHQDLAETCSSNEYLLRYLCANGTMK
ncbi:hypothetical protein AMTRI_Chr05g67220 [Amborella trichopoda]